MDSDDIPPLTEGEIAQIRHDYVRKHETNVMRIMQEWEPFYEQKAREQSEASLQQPTDEKRLYASTVDARPSTASAGPTSSHRVAEPVDALAGANRSGVQPPKATYANAPIERFDESSSDDIQIIGSRLITRHDVQKPTKSNLSSARSRREKIDTQGQAKSDQPPSQPPRLTKVAQKAPSKASRGGSGNAESSATTNDSSSATRSKRSHSTSMYSGLQPTRKSIQQKAPKTAAATSPIVRENDDPVASSSANPHAPAPPRWYIELKTYKRRVDRSEISVLLQRLKEGVKRYRVSRAPKCLDNIRELLHTIPFVEVTDRILRNERMLHNEDGLPKLFNSSLNDNIEFPYDIRADAEELYNKWCSRIFSTDIMRGIVMGVPKGRRESNDKTGDSIDPEWHKISARYHGNGKLLNGQWWPTQLCTLRDGAHGYSIQGISGEPEEGAYSIVMAGGLDSLGQKYANEDHGQWVLYCGTDGKNGEMSADTIRMTESYENKRFVRLIRSHNLKSDYAPEVGYRYDGLYEVVGMENLDDGDTSRERRRFRLERRTEEPFRGGNGPERRPTRQEIEEYNKSRLLRGLTS
ncbi:hypothetical protein K431DRAFT_284976 [Polychaeton citri CBS 116435]|uniref:YDG domain-containing protein n=1 Tax=Polychaeton citri CBS 116435 TaxID=1314669 RepID=A0A9P4UP42_9PEZI|nr:hypothetical protein K431DRAFT_284976 [Polychaeton citri CBS 116435]